MTRWLLGPLLAAALFSRLAHAQESAPVPEAQPALAPETQPAVLPAQPELAPPAQPELVPPAQPELAPPAQPELAPQAPPAAAPAPVPAPAPVYAQPAEAPRPSARDIVIAYNTGLRFSIAPGIFLPSHGDLGFSIAGDVRFGVSLGPIILAPGARLAAFFPSGWVALAALATGRLTVPLGPVAPYVVGGAGPGYVSEPSQAGLAWLGGGGLMVHFSRAFALGVEASYQGITETRFRALFVGPSLLIGF